MLGRGGHGVLTKPIRQDVLLQAITDCVSHNNVTAPEAGSHRIVIVEDNDDLRDTFRILLEMRGHVVFEVRNGIDGLACILADRPDVAIIDIGLSGLDGYEVARRVRATIGPATFLIATTGYAQDSDRARARAAGFDAHFVKPFDFELIEQLLGER